MLNCGYTYIHIHIYINFQQTSLVFVMLLIDFDNVFGGWAPFKTHSLYKNQQNFDEAKCSCSWRHSVSKSSYFVLIYYETFLLFHGKNYSEHGRNYLPMGLGPQWYQLGSKTCYILKIKKLYVRKGHLFIIL